MAYSLINNYRKKRFYSNLIVKNNLCFDIGANVGNKSKLFLSLGAKVIAFEPQSSCAQKLDKLKDINKNFDFKTIGVGEITEVKTLHLGSHSEVSSFSEKFMNYFKNDTIYWKDTEDVHISTLNAIITKYGIPDYCKIDAEGYEQKILKNLTTPIRIIELEFTSGFMEETTKIIDKLSSLGITRWNYNLNEKPKFELSKWVSSDQIITVLRTLPKQRLHGNLFVKTNIS